MNEEITASITYDEKSMSPAYRWHSHRQNRAGVIAGVMAVVLFSLLFWAAHATSASSGPVITPSFVLAPVGVVVLVLLMRWLGPVLFARAIKSSPSHGSLLTYRISETGVRAGLDNTKAEYPWARFQRSIITPDGILLYIRKNAFNWFPKNAFPSASDYTRFLTLVTAKTKHSQIG